MPAPSAATEPPLPQLSWRSFSFALGVTLVIFFGLHPLWRPLDMDAMDRNISWSYAPIPLLVLVLLALEHKLRWSTLVLETVRLTLVKFVITFVVANILWAFVGPPPPAESARDAPLVTDTSGRFDVVEPPPPTPIDPARTGVLQGVVTGAGGEPAAGAFVAVTDGLDGVVFAPRPGGVVLTHDGSGLRPRAAVVLTHERLVLRGTEDLVHSVAARDDTGRLLFNVPLGTQAEDVRMFHRALGRVTLQCTVHDHHELVTELQVVANPFAAWTGADGGFRFEGVPAADGARHGSLQLTARDPLGREAQAAVVLHPGEELEELRLELP